MNATDTKIQSKGAEPIAPRPPTQQRTTNPRPPNDLAALQAGAGNAALAAAATNGSFTRYGEGLPQQSTFGNTATSRALSRGEDRIQAKLTVSAPDDPLEREADRVADHVVNGGDSLHRSIAEAATSTLQRQEALTDKPREPPTKFPPQEVPKHGAEKEDEEKEKLVKGGLKAAGEFARRLWDDFSNSLPGKSILAANERDWKPILKFFEDFASTLIGKIIFGAAAGGAATGAFLGARSARDESGAPGTSPSDPSAPLAPKDEKFFALELNWDFVSPPTGFTLKTPWLDLPKIGGSSSSSSSTALPPAPQLIKPAPKIPRICTPSDPAGDRGEAAARDAQIYGWLLWKQQQDEARMNEILRRNLQPPGEIWRPGQPYKFTPSQVSQVKPLFKRVDEAEESHDPKAVEEGLRLAGQSLDPETRAFMEPRFGRDLSQVQIHTDAQAAKSAESVNALAYTVGRDVVFGAGQYQPATDSGRRLLAHELAHTIQQGAAGATGPAVRTSGNKPPPPAFDTRASVQRLPVTRGSPLQPKLTIGAANDHYEQEADRVAQQVMSMPILPSAFTGQATIQGQVPKEDEVAQTKPLAATITPLVQCAPSDPQGSFEPGADFESRLSTSGGGSPLPASTRAFMEPRFGADFSKLRLHTGSEAAQLNRAVSAQAFTLGKDIYLGEGKNDLESSAGKQLLAHELAHVVQQSCLYGSREWVRRVPLPDYSQKGDTCDPASLMTALILWDKENAVAGSSNANIVGICNAALLYMSKNKPPLISLYSRTGNGETVFDFNIQYLSATRDRLRTTGTSASEGEYQILSTILNFFGHDASDVLRKLGLTEPKNKGGNYTLADIFADSDLQGLKPGESAQINWLTIVQQRYTDGRSAGSSVGLHAFLVGRGKSGMWFLSDQGITPALHLEAISLEAIRTNLNQAATAGKTNIVTDPVQTNTTLGWTGVRILQAQDYSKPFQNLAPPGRFLAEVDAGWGTTGERVFTWDFVGTGYSLKEVEDLFKSSGTGHGFLIGERPIGVYNVYKTNPVSSDNAAVTEIDKSDSKDGLLLNTSVFINASLKLRTAKDSSTSGLGFKVY